MKTFNLVLTHDEIVALAKTIDFWSEENEASPFDGETLTMFLHLGTLAAKLPDESILDEMAEPDGILTEQDVQDLEQLAAEMCGIIVEMGARGMRVDVETVVGPPRWIEVKGTK